MSTYSEPIRDTMDCPKCAEPSLYYQYVTSFDEGTEDILYECHSCFYGWWVDGIDS